MYKWYINSSFFEEEKELVSKYYPTLKYIEENKNFKLIGELYIKEIDDSYSIEINFLDDYPNSLPIVKEIGNDIPKELDRHISYDGTCCLCVPQLEKYYFPKGSNIKDFLDKLVVPFFANQAYFELTGEWINGEYAHGILGIYEFYNNLLGIKNINEILNLLKIVKKSIPNFNKKCPCNSGKSVRKCHLVKIVQLKKIIRVDQLNNDIEEFSKIIIKKRSNHEL